MKAINFRRYVNLHLLFLLYSVTIVTAKMASSYTFLNLKFYLFYILEIMMTIVYVYFWQKTVKWFTLVEAYSNKGIVILWTLIWSALLFHEKVCFSQLTGMIIIILGISLVMKDG